MSQFLLANTTWINLGVWFVLFIILTIIEADTVQFVSIWFAVGSFAALILAAFGVMLYIQIIVFVVLSLLLLIFTKPLVKRLTKSSTQEFNVNSLINEEVVVTKEIGVGSVGEIKSRYERYNAISPSSLSTILVGEKVIITSVSGNKVIVEKK